MVKRKSILEKNVRGKGSNADFTRKKIKVGKKKAAASNATSTAFSVRRVTVREQSVGVEKGVMVTHRGHDVKELLRLMQHAKHQERTQALLGLKELLQKHPRVVEVHAVKIVDRVLQRVADPEAETRRQLHSTLHTLLTLLERERRIEPFLRKIVVVICKDLGLPDHRKRRAALVVIDLLIQCCPSVAARLRAFDPAYVGGSGEAQLLQSLRSLVDMSGIARGSAVTGGILEKFRSAEKAKAKAKKKTKGGVKYDEVRLSAVATLHRVLTASRTRRANAVSEGAVGANAAAANRAARISSATTSTVPSDGTPLSVAQPLTRRSVADDFTGWAPLGASWSAAAPQRANSAARLVQQRRTQHFGVGAAAAAAAGDGEPQTTLALIQGVFDVWMEVAPTATAASAASASAKMIKMATGSGGEGRRGGGGSGGGGGRPARKGKAKKSGGGRKQRGGRAHASQHKGLPKEELPKYLLHLRLALETLRHLVHRVAQMAPAVKARATAVEIARRKANDSGTKKKALTVTTIGAALVKTLLGNFPWALTQSPSWDELELELEVCVGLLLWGIARVLARRPAYCAPSRAHTSRLTPRASHLAPHTSRLTPHASYARTHTATTA